jgi:[histone H3]-lysine36 N-dimethyltransferase SETMAR
VLPNRWWQFSFESLVLVAAIPLVEQRTVNAEWYSTVCSPAVFAKVTESRPRTGLRGILLHHDNATAHTAARTIDFLNKWKVQLLPHPPYSPDLAPCHFFLFPHLKHQLGGKRYPTAQAALEAMQDILDQVPVELFQKCFSDWFDRMSKCKRAHGGYFQKL